ncbi:MAG: hypothetical protein SOW06_03550 [Succinivibrionaceae bacterium]|nr:DUF805 domain-containing protein [Pseudomonadota bacterium]MDD6545972.1 hypothetical protein [Pseudomonadota bacterium]MDY3144419.1 hypothetical protein [Succinivibrionaceae bacterium]
MTRLPFFLATIGITVLMVIAMFLVAICGTPTPAGELSSGQNAMAKLIGVLGTAAMMFISAKRSVNMGWSGWTCLLYLVPVVNAVYFFICLFKRPVY